MIKLKREFLKDIIDSVENIPREVQDEMAIPTYRRIFEFLRFDNSIIPEFGCEIGVLLPSPCKKSAKLHEIYFLLNMPEYSPKR
jgi:hypothetical protein